MSKLRPFSDRENFIVASTIMITSEQMKGIDRKTRQNILQYIRETKYPEVTDQDWKEIAQGINDHKKDVFGLMVRAFNESTSNPETFADKATVELDTSVKDELDDIDFNELKKIVDESDDPQLREYYLTMRQLLRDYNDERKESGI